MELRLFYTDQEIRDIMDVSETEKLWFVQSLYRISIGQQRRGSAEKWLVRRICDGGISEHYWS